MTSRLRKQYIHTLENASDLQIHLDLYTSSMQNSMILIIQAMDTCACHKASVLLPQDSAIWECSALFGHADNETLSSRTLTMVSQHHTFWILSQVRTFPGIGRVQVHSVLRRWNAEVKVGWRLASAFVDRVAHRNTAPVLDVEIFAHALRFHLDPPTTKTIMAFHAHVLYYYRYYSFRRLRPQVQALWKPSPFMLYSQPQRLFNTLMGYFASPRACKSSALLTFHLQGCQSLS